MILSGTKMEAVSELESDREWRIPARQMREEIIVAGVVEILREQGVLEPDQEIQELIVQLAKKMVARRPIGEDVSQVIERIALTVGKKIQDKERAVEWLVAKIMESTESVLRSKITGD